MRRPFTALNRNHYFVIGLLLGLLLSWHVPQDIWEEECPEEAAENLLIERFGQEFEPHLNLINKPLAAKKPMAMEIDAEIWIFGYVEMRSMDEPRWIVSDPSTPVRTDPVAF
ncbi:GM11515 [Drosophila sechellia]|uniref:GM11515 n=1 Tax=Drosophila sechellia TaxID=7238 RepID=B4IGM4_DROSE|nr:GM11515 [Drosophila sechellia]